MDEFQLNGDEDRPLRDGKNKVILLVGFGKQNYFADPRVKILDLNKCRAYWRPRQDAMSVLAPCVRNIPNQGSRQPCIRFVVFQNVPIRGYAKRQTFPPALVDEAKKGTKLSPLRSVKIPKPHSWRVKADGKKAAAGRQPVGPSPYRNIQDYKKARTSNKKSYI